MLDKLNEIFEAYLIATGKNPNDDSIRVGIESDWICHKAKNYLSIDNTGLLSILTMREAFKSFIKEHSYTIEDLLNNDWNKEKKKYIHLEYLLNSGEIGQVYDKFIDLIIKHASVLGKEYTQEQIGNIKKIENIIVTSIEKFTDRHTFKHEKFNEGQLKVNKNVDILPRLYRFQHLKLFVDKMKHAKEDNFICMALIDRTNELIEDEYYDNNLDSFFAFGFKNNGVVWVVSDRVTYDSPEGAFKSRNPGRNMRDKIDYSWLPYYKLNEIKQSNDHINQVLLPFNNNAMMTGYNIVDLFDDEAIIYSVLIMTLIYNKYFYQEFEDNSKRLYFSSEIKLLPQTNSRALALKNELQLPTPANNIKAESYCYEHLDKSYSNSMYDYLIDMYPLETTVPTLKSFIGDKDKAQQYVWWNIRKQQVEHIKNCLRDNYFNNEHLIVEWERVNVLKNLKNIVEFMIDNPDKDCYRENYSSTHTLVKSEKPLFWEEYRDDKILETYKLKTVATDDSFNHSGYQGAMSTKYGDIKYSCYGNHNYITFIDDNESRKCEIELILRSHSDLQRFFNLNTIEELPREMRKHFYARSGPCTKLAWEPYTGNSILNFTDPMNEIRNPFDDIGCTIYLYLSKTKLKQFKRKLSEKSWDE